MEKVSRSFGPRRSASPLVCCCVIPPRLLVICVVSTAKTAQAAEERGREEIRRLREELEVMERQSVYDGEGSRLSSALFYTVSLYDR